MAQVSDGPGTAARTETSHPGASGETSFFERLSDRLNAATELLLAALVAVTVGSVIAQVIFRYVIQESLTWSEEIARYSFIWSIFLGTSVAARRNQHIVVDALLKIFPPRLRHVTRRLNGLLSIGFFALFFYTSLLLVENAIPQKSSALEISIAWVYASALLGSALTVLHLVCGQISPSPGEEK